MLSIATNADVLVLRMDQCQNLKIALNDADATLEDVKNLTDVNIKNAVKYSLTQNKAGNSLTARHINASWINTDLSYNQLVDAAKTCKMPLPYESPAQKKAKSAAQGNALSCNHIEHLYSFTVDYASKTGALDMALNYPLSQRKKVVTQVMDQATKSVCEGNYNKGSFNWNPKGEYTFQKLQNAYANCVAKYNK